MRKCAQKVFTSLSRTLVVMGSKEGGGWLRETWYLRGKSERLHVCVCVCCVFKMQETPYGMLGCLSGGGRPAKGRGQIYKTTRYRGWVGNPEHLACPPSWEFGKRNGSVDTFMKGNGGGCWPALFLYLLRGRGDKYEVRRRKIIQV